MKISRLESLLLTASLATPIPFGAAKERWADIEQSRQDVEEAAPRNGFRVGGDLRKWQTRSAVAFRDVGASSGFQGVRDEHYPLALVWNE